MLFVSSIWRFSVESLIILVSGVTIVYWVLSLI